jgi:dienelactone hydrolase
MSALVLSLALAFCGLAPLQRDDLARSFLRFEAAYAARAPEAMEQIDIERRFDALSMQFLGGNFADALLRLDALTAALETSHPSAERAAFDAICFRLRDDVVTLGALYVPELDEPVALDLTLVALDAEARELARERLALSFDDLDGVSAEVDLGVGEPARIDTLRVTDAAGCTRDIHPAGEEGRGVRRLRDDEALAAIDGDTHRTFRLGDVSLAARVFVPPHDDTPLPLVIALHGAGGDEHMFFEAYGQGRLVRLAREQGFVAVAPLTYTVLARPDAFPALIDAIAAFAPIDRTRVYVLGHSLGGITTIELLSRHSDRIAAACCIAGGSPTAKTSPTLPRTLVVFGGIDPLMGGKSLEATTARAVESGVPLTVRLERERGHTLLVGDLLPDVIAWLTTGAKPPRDR